MRITRIYQNCTLSPGNPVVLNAESAHHLVHVLRTRTGDQIAVFNGEGGYYDAVVVETGKRRLVAEVREFHPDDCESTLDLTLAQGISRSQHMDMALQKAVELGVKTIVPVQCEYSPGRYSTSQQEKKSRHWQKILVAACEQCGRNRLPVLHKPVEFMEYVRASTGHLKIILNPHASAGMTDLVCDSNRVTLMTGPEGGFSQEEIRQSSQYGYHDVSLGPRILRTETAAIAAITACQVIWGDLR